MFAKRYHPDNGCTGCQGRFDAVTKAYRVLSDAEKRPAYDAGYEQIRNRRWKLAFATAKTSNGNGKDQDIRNAVLSVLYVKRRNNPGEGSIGLWQLEKILGCPFRWLSNLSTS
jgi:curved DNA-binding protein